MSENHKKSFTALNYIEYWRILDSGCVLVSAFVSLVGIPTGIAISAAGLKIYEITVGIKKA